VPTTIKPYYLPWRTTKLKFTLPKSAARMSLSSVTADATTSPSLTFFEDGYVEASLSTRPSTPGDTIIRIKTPALSYLGYLQKDEYIQTLISSKHVAKIVKTATRVRRVSLVWDGASEIRLIPLHGIDAEWKPMMDPQLEYHTSYPGYVTSRSGPKHSNETLEKFQADVTNGNQPAMDLTCYSTPETSQNLFAKIIRGELEQWRVWESESHVAFLTPFGNTPAKTVLVPRKHVDSDILGTPIEDFEDLAGATWGVVTALMRSRLEPDRVGLIFEGMEINWAHAKLIPICGDVGNTSEQPFVEKYTGAVSSQPGPSIAIEELKEMRQRFFSASKRS
jgi:diadenosine tetraphosphate (Ap4A) HIT family hydrolase